MRVLVIEDAPEVVESIILCLTIRWPELVLIATGSGSEAIPFARATTPDLILLDLKLTDLYGLQTLKEIRRFSGVPVIIITARDDETSRQQCLEMGADDYLVKPFSHIELLGSIEAALARNIPAKAQEEHEELAGGSGLVIDLPGHRVMRNGLEISLTIIEWRVLIALLHNQGHISTYAGLAREGWGTDAVTRSTIASCVRLLRAKLGDNPHKPDLIRLVQNEGYSLILSR